MRKILLLIILSTCVLSFSTTKLNERDIGSSFAWLEQTIKIDSQGVLNKDLYSGLVGYIYMMHGISPSENKLFANSYPPNVYSWSKIGFDAERFIALEKVIKKNLTKDDLEGVYASMLLLNQEALKSGNKDANDEFYKIGLVFGEMNSSLSNTFKADLSNDNINKKVKMIIHKGGTNLIKNKVFLKYLSYCSILSVDDKELLKKSYSR
ncbi:MAG: hypothetical protein PHF25_08250 [Candidatus Margulisbacteria bacterium]|nr:hypothetical protein [Candidatus Margulisiibacteriota bacterium]